MRRHILLLTVFLGIPLLAQTTRLKQGDAVQLRGVLTLQSVGRLQFVTVRTTHAIVPVFLDNGHMHDGEELREIGLGAVAPYAVLYRHRGETVTLAGTMQTDEANPYFWHGTRVEVRSLRTAAGEELVTPATSAAPLIAGRGFSVFVLLPADLAAPWNYRYMGPNSLEIQGTDALHCRSNGAGDVVDCFCAAGYHPTEAKATVHGKRVRGTLLDFAQFPVSDADDREDFDVALMVACAR